MNLQSYHTSDDTPTNSTNKKPLIIGVVIAIIAIIAIAAILVNKNNNEDKGDADNSNPIISTSDGVTTYEDGTTVYIPQYDEDGNIDTGIDTDYYDANGDLRIPDEVVTLPESEQEDVELEYETAPVPVIYNPEVDTDDNGDISLDEWQVWVDAHPEDLNQDLVIDDAELAEFNGEEPPEDVITDDNILGNAEDRVNAWLESQGGGVPGFYENSENAYVPIITQPTNGVDVE